MKKFTILIVIFAFTCFLVACESQLPEGSYRVIFDNMEPHIMNDAIVRIEPIEDPDILKEGDFVLIEWHEDTLEQIAYKAFQIVKVQSFRIPDNTTYYTIHVSSSNNDESKIYTPDDLLGVIVEIKNPSK